MKQSFPESALPMQREINDFAAVLAQEGVHAGLKFLNARTPHRYTGIFRFEDTVLRNEALYDRYHLGPQKAPDKPLHTTYCAMVGRRQVPLIIQDATTDARVLDRVESPVMSYYGVLMRDAARQPFGTLCHYDMQRCQARVTDLPLLEAAADMLYHRLWPSPPLQVTASEA